MTNIGFPLSLKELTEMRKDGDKVSLIFSYACIGCILLSISFLAIYYLLSCEIFKTFSIITIPLATIFLFILWFYRPLFLAHKEKNIKTTIMEWMYARREYYKDKKIESIYLEPEQLSKRFGFRLEQIMQALSELLKEGKIFMDGKGEFWFLSKDKDEHKNDTI